MGKKNLFSQERGKRGASKGMKKLPTEKAQIYQGKTFVGILGDRKERCEGETKSLFY